MWLLCSFQGPSERATRACAGTVAGDGRRGLSKLNSMQAPRKRSALSKLGRHARSRRRSRSAVCRPGEPAAPILELPRKEVIQPHLPVRLPCYDFTPVTNPAVVIALLAVRLTTSGRTRSHGVTGGVYKTRERIHRDMLIRDY